MTSTNANGPADGDGEALQAIPNRFPGQSHGQARLGCDCIGRIAALGPAAALEIHTEIPDPTGPIGLAIREAVRSAAQDRREVFAPAQALRPEHWNGLTALPSELGRLTDVKHLLLYGSALRSIPPDIGRMTALELFEPYTSYGLHWFPYEITRCPALRDSTVSTRAIYGNRKTRLPFPLLPARLPAHLFPDTCSVCDRPFAVEPIQRWITLRVATDDLALLVHACAESCIASLPPPADGYVGRPHVGGPDLEQPSGPDW